jgi:ADP-heptose:LPS heptosyltransferase
MRPRLLVLRALGLGDHLTGLPALRALRRAFPDHELVLAAPSALAPLVRLDGAVDRLLPTAELAPVRWSGPPPDLAVDLHGNGPASRRLLEALAPHRLLAFADGFVGWDADEHERHRWCRLLAEGLGVPADPDDLLLPVPDLAPAPDGVVVVHAGAASPARRWPVDRVAAVAAELTRSGHRVVLTGGRSEADLVEAVRRGAGLPPEAALAGRTGLLELAALVARARLVVAGDTGVAHLASAYRTPSVLLFGPTPPHRWGPPPDGPHSVLWHGEVHGAAGVGDPHGHRTDPALLAITVPEVLAAAEGRLEAAPAPAEGRPGARR